MFLTLFAMQRYISQLSSAIKIPSSTQPLPHYAANATTTTVPLLFHQFYTFPCRRMFHFTVFSPCPMAPHASSFVNMYNEQVAYFTQDKPTYTPACTCCPLSHAFIFSPLTTEQISYKFGASSDTNYLVFLTCILQRINAYLYL